MPDPVVRIHIRSDCVHCGFNAVYTFSNTLYYYQFPVADRMFFAKDLEHLGI